MTTKLGPTIQHTIGIDPGNRHMDNQILWSTLQASKHTCKYVSQSTCHFPVDRSVLMNPQAISVVTPRHNDGLLENPATQTQPRLAHTYACLPNWALNMHWLKELTKTLQAGREKDSQTWMWKGMLQATASATMTGFCPDCHHIWASRPIYRSPSRWISFWRLASSRISCNCLAPLKQTMHPQPTGTWNTIQSQILSYASKLVMEGTHCGNNYNE